MEAAVLEHVVKVQPWVHPDRVPLVSVVLQVTAMATQSWSPSGSDGWPAIQDALV
jgi:hypothetical protein